MINVLLSLDLTDAGDERDGFNAFLADLEWKKLKHVDTVWAIEYPKYSAASETDVSYVKGNISRILTAAAEKFEFARITYVAQIGNVELVGRYIKKKDGVYKLFEYSPF
jgi:hypothetical protein